MQHFLDTLSETHATIQSMAITLSDTDYRTQYHTDLSPLGWHVGHCLFIESYWLREVVLGDDSLTADLAWLYIPENIVKPKRGPALPPIDEHLAWCQEIATENHHILQQPTAAFTTHKLNKDDYLLQFIIQHHSQHIETMAMVLAQRQLQLKPPLSNNTPLVANDNIDYQFKTYPSGYFNIGSPSHPEAFDNELPPQKINIGSFSLAEQPVSNADWLAFIDDNGYQDKHWWDEAGWQWCLENNIRQPEMWQRDENNQFYDITIHGADKLYPDAAVSGINYFEANAFVNWLKANSDNYSTVRLPHEYEWEVAEQSGQLINTGQVWEWCQNNFHPYPGFTAFPYDNYSKPWFDDNHYSLRGSSPYTQSSIRRSSFRNFYNPDKRHIFSGLRLATSIG